MSQDPQALEELKRVVGRLATPTIVIDGQVFVGFATNRAKIEAALKGVGGPQPAAAADRGQERDDEERLIIQILKESKTIAVVGLSPDPSRPSHGVARYLIEQGYHVIPVNPMVNQVLGQKSYPDLAAVPERMDVVDIFRSPEHVPPIVEAAIVKGIPTVWMQEGIINEEAARRARDAGLRVVMDRCMMKEHFSLKHEGKL